MRCALAHVVFAVLVVAGGACAPSDHADDQWKEELSRWKFPAPLPSFPLVDENGRAFRLRDGDRFTGGPTLFGFVFTRCPVADACPMTMSRLAQVHALAPALHIVVVTLDPEHDTPSVLREYQQRFHAEGITMVSGAPDVIGSLASLFNVVAVKQGESFAHPVKVALVDKEMRPVREWTDNHFFPQEIIDAASAQ